jgi:hypothetical protein
VGWQSEPIGAILKESPSGRNGLGMAGNSSKGWQLDQSSPPFSFPLAFIHTQKIPTVLAGASKKEKSPPRGNSMALSRST